MGKLFCPKCQINTRVYGNGYHNYYLTLFRTREEKGKEKKWIFKDEITWVGDYFNRSYKSIKDCWEETGGLTEEEIRKWAKSWKWKCHLCDYESDSLFTFISKKENIISEENNRIKQLEKEIEVEKSKNTFLNDRINIIMKELNEIKIILNKNPSLIKSG